MIGIRILAIVVASTIASPAMAQTTSSSPGKAGPHYLGGPKSPVPPHFGETTTTGMAAKPKPDGGHHYSGGPRADPHHMGPKQ